VKEGKHEMEAINKRGNNGKRRGETEEEVFQYHKTVS
jgi:hypothetical protein